MEKLERFDIAFQDVYMTSPAPGCPGLSPVSDAMWIPYCSNSVAIKSGANIPWGTPKPSNTPHIWTRRARDPRLAMRKVPFLLAPQKRAGISVGQSLTRAKIAQEIRLRGRLDSLNAITLFHTPETRTSATAQISRCMFIRNLRRGTDATLDYLGLSISAKRPDPTEFQHDFLWRSIRNLPERGRIDIFNRSYYEEVLIARVHLEILHGEGSRMRRATITRYGTTAIARTTRKMPG